MSLFDMLLKILCSTNKLVLSTIGESKEPLGPDFKGFLSGMSIICGLSRAVLIQPL